MLKVWEKAPAKINLTLDVLGMRTDRYHEVEMIMTMIDLADRLLFKETIHDEILLESNTSFVPNDERNIIFKAAKLIKSEFNINKGLNIYLEKKIPVAAGLAGGSSDAAATLRGLNRLWKLNLSENELMRYGEKLGADVPFCVVGGTAIVRGRGEKVEKINPLPPGWVILAKPAISVSTQEIYNNLNLSDIKVHPKNEKMLKAIDNGDLSEISKLLFNVLEPVTFKLYPQVEYLYQQMKQYGADDVLMSGSGPTIFTLVNKESRMNRIYNALRGFCKEVYMVRLLK